MKRLKIIIVFWVILFSSVANVSSQAITVETGKPSIETRRLQQDIREILKDPKFQYHDYLDWVKEKISQFFAWLAKLKPKKVPFQTKLFDTVIKWIGIGALALLPFVLIYFLPKLFNSSFNRQLKDSKPQITEIGYPDLKSTAAMYAAKSDFREAIRYLYLASLGLLKKFQILPSGVQLTDKVNLSIFRQSLGVDHPGYHPFLKLVQVYQAKWYGLKEFHSEDYILANEYSIQIHESLDRINVKK